MRRMNDFVRVFTTTTTTGAAISIMGMAITKRGLPVEGVEKA